MPPAQRTGFAKLSQRDLAAAIARHEMLYTGRMGGARAVFAFCDLSGLDLSGHNLADADFTGAILEEANLSGAKLDSTSFYGADLRRVAAPGATVHLPTRDHWRTAQLAAGRARPIGVVPGNPGSGTTVRRTKNYFSGRSASRRSHPVHPSACGDIA